MVVLGWVCCQLQPPPLFIPWPSPLGGRGASTQPSSKIPSGRESGEGAGLHNLLVTWWGRRAQELPGFGDPHSWEWEGDPEGWRWEKHRIWGTLKTKGGANGSLVSKVGVINGGGRCL